MQQEESKKRAVGKESVIENATGTHHRKQEESVIEDAPGTHHRCF